jgi:hypothetical protein
MALRTAIRGALIVSRLLNSLNLIWGECCPNNKAAASGNLCGFVSGQGSV